MVFLWFSYGFPMVLLWFSYGFPMVFLGFYDHFPHVQRHQRTRGGPHGTAVNGQQIALHDVALLDDALGIHLDTPGR